MDRASIGQRGGAWSANAKFVALCLLSAFPALFLFTVSSQAIPFWPPAGLVAAFLLTGGRRLLPGVLVSALLLGLTVGVARYRQDGGAAMLVIGVATGLGLLVEAGFAILARRRSEQARDDPAASRRIFLPLLIVAPLLAALLRTAAAKLAVPLFPSALLFDALVWWLGDSLGIAVFAPLTLAWIGRRASADAMGGITAAEIAQLKAQKNELEKLRRRYALILDSVDEGIIGISASGAITFANRTAGQLLGYPPEEMVGHPLDQLIQSQPGAGAPVLLHPAALAALRAGEITATAGSDAFIINESKILSVDFQLAPKIENGKTVGAVVVFRDASLRLEYERSLADHRKDLEREVAERTAELRREVAIRTQMEAALLVSRERHKRITDNIFEGVLGFGNSGQLVFANPAARRLLDCEGFDEDIEGHPLDVVLRLCRDGQPILFANSPWQRVISENLVQQEDEATFITASGRAIPVAYACSPLPFDDGRYAAILSFRDIETLKAAQRKAIQASRMASVGQLAAGIAHEINTPIQYIGDNLRYIGETTSKLLKTIELSGWKSSDSGLSTMAAELADAVRESLDGVTQIARIVLSMKEFSHPGTSTKTITDINKALENTLTVSRNEWKLSVDVIRRMAPDLPPVLCHAGEMNQVFLNLIINAIHAIKASGKPEPGRITVTTRRAGQSVQISIADSGTGIPEAIREKIFDPFFTTKEVGKGTGQGLAICRDVVMTKHGGSIDMVSRPGEGAEFIVTLPLDQAGPGALEEE